MAEPAPRFSFDEVLELLETHPGRIAAATAAVPAAELVAPLEPGGWSARDILGHIRACDITWGSYIVQILDEDRPSIRVESPRSTIRRTDFLELPFAESLNGFTVDRASLLGRIRAGAADTLSRAASVRLPGRGVEARTAFYYAHRLAEHEREHVLHIERAMKERPA